MKISTEAMNTITVFFIIFVFTAVTIQRVEHQEQMASDKKLIKSLDKNSESRERYIKQMEIVEKGQIKTNELLKYQNKLLEKRR